jgi:hypothetical protein
MAIATKFGYRRRSPDVLANALLALALVGVCLVGWEVLAPAQLPALAGRHGPEGRSLLALPLDTSSTTLFPSPPPPAPKQPKHFTGAEKARSRAAGCSRAPAGPFLRLPQARLSARHRTAFERVAPTPATLSLAVRHARCSPAPGSALVAPALGFMLTLCAPVPPPRQFCVIFYIGGVLYCLLGFAVVCEEYFVASLLVLGDKFHLSDDVNGAGTWPLHPPL